MAAKRIDVKWEASLGTDGAGFMIHHPSDVGHLSAGWVVRAATVRKELEAGTLVGFTTSGQGQYQIHLTSKPLGSRASKWVVKSYAYRLAVKHGRVFVDNGDCLPGEGRGDPEKLPAQWADVPNGSYRVTVNAIRWYDEPGALDEKEKRTEASLPDYIIQFEMVESLAEITPPKKLPALW